MKKLRSSALLLLLFSVVIFSCKKDDDDTPPADQSCKVVKAYYYDNNVVDDSASYTYTGSQVTKVTLSDGDYYTYEYSNNRVSKRNYFESGSTAVSETTQVTYNGDGTISKIESFDRTGGANELFGRIDFMYNGGKLAKTTLNAIDNGTATKLAEDIFEYTGNNITKVTTTTYFNGTQTSSVSFAYDTNANYFTKQNKDFFLIDPFFGEELGGAGLAFIISANNVSSVSSNTIPFPIPLTYTLDAKGNLTKLSAANESLIGYTYQCP